MDNSPDFLFNNNNNNNNNNKNGISSFTSNQILGSYS